MLSTGPPGQTMPPTTPTGFSDGSFVSLRQVAESQKKLESMVGKMLERITNLEAKSSSSPTTSSGSEMEKTRLPPELSCLVADIHSRLDPEDQLKPEHRLDSAENMSVKERIREEIVVGKENSYSSLLVNKAIKRYYESRRRIWREGQSPQKNRVESRAKKRKVRSRRQRLFDRCTKFVKQSEQKKWKDISLDFMSEESSGEEPEEILVHHLPWRSQSLQKLINKLDDRAQADSMRTKKYTAK